MCKHAASHFKRREELQRWQKTNLLLQKPPSLFAGVTNPLRMVQRSARWLAQRNFPIVAAASCTDARLPMQEDKTKRDGAKKMDTLGIEPRASRMLSGCDTTTPCALLGHGYQAFPKEAGAATDTLSTTQVKRSTMSNTVAILAQGTHRAVASSQAFLPTTRLRSNPHARIDALQDIFLILQI